MCICLQIQIIFAVAFINRSTVYFFENEGKRAEYFINILDSKNDQYTPDDSDMSYIKIIGIIETIRIVTRISKTTSAVK